MGGGSTEICVLKTQPAGAAGAGSVAGQAPELSLYAWLSVPIGVITLSERYGTERYGTGRKVSGADAATSYRALERSEERRVGKECVSTCRSRWSQYL